MLAGSLCDAQGIGPPSGDGGASGSSPSLPCKLGSRSALLFYDAPGWFGVMSQHPVYPAQGCPNTHPMEFLKGKEL